MCFYCDFILLTEPKELRMNLYRKWQVFRISLLFFRGTPIIFAAIILAVSSLIIWVTIHFFEIKKNRIHHVLELQATKLESELDNRIDHTFAISQNINAQIIKDPSNNQHINKILSRFKTTEKLRNSFSWTNFSWTNPT